MASRYVIASGVHCAFIQIHGEFQRGEGIQALKDAIGEPDFVKGMGILMDFRAVNLAGALSYDRVLSMIPHFDMETDLLGSCQMAIVVGTTADFGKARQVASLADRPNIERAVFIDIKKALEWLDVPVDYEIQYGSKPDNDQSPA